MKKLLCILALGATIVSQAATTKVLDNGANLAGIWQQVQKFKGERQIIRLPVWKVLQKDGTFCTFLIANKSAQSIITNQGTYRITSDSTYVEHINGSITDPKLVGRDNAISFYMKDADSMSISYLMPGAKRRGLETWVRVKLEMPTDEIAGPDISEEEE